MAPIYGNRLYLQHQSTTSALITSEAIRPAFQRLSYAMTRQPPRQQRSSASRTFVSDSSLGHRTATMEFWFPYASLPLDLTSSTRRTHPRHFITTKLPHLYLTPPSSVGGEDRRHPHSHHFHSRDPTFSHVQPSSPHLSHSRSHIACVGNSQSGRTPRSLHSCSRDTHHWPCPNEHIFDDYTK